MNERQTALKYPPHWSQATVDTYENLYALGRVTQADIDEIEARLAWFRQWRDWFGAQGQMKRNGTTSV